MPVMHTTRGRTGQSSPAATRAVLSRWRPAVLPATLVGLALAAMPAVAAESTDIRIDFELDARQRAQRAIVEQIYADELAAIAAGSDQPVRIGIGNIVAAFPSADRASILENSIWALFDHPNACNADGCRLVHLYREEASGGWLSGFDGYATGELIRFYKFTGIGKRVGCIQMATGALYLFAWDEELVAPGGSC